MNEPKATMNLQEIIGNIEKNKILLPDFQRKFVWTEEERQKKLVSSILTKMPIGSILLLESNPKEYSSKIIGCKTINANDSEENVEFLLDGQQRITVLTNVFSNVIHNHCSKVSDLVSPTLKRRFFLEIPKWKMCREKPDLFGVHNLNFLYKDPDANDPDFLSGDILQFVFCESYKAGDESPFNPKNNLSPDLDDYCLNHNSGYLLPLFLMTPSSEINSSQAKLRLNTIRKNIAKKIREEIEDHFVALKSCEAQQAFVEEIFYDDPKCCEEIKNNRSLFEKYITERAEVWEGELKEYLDSCVKNVSLNKIVVSAEKRARAIDIYENLNIGGVCLNIFDLVMAKVAKVDNTPYYDRITKCIKEKKEYPRDVIPPDVLGCMKYKKIEDVNGKNERVSSDMLGDKYYNASVWTNCYNEEKNDMQSVIDMLKESGSVEWIERNVDYIMEAQNFSDKQLILMEKTSEERFPKRILRNFMCQFLLSKTYTDMFEKNQIVSVFSDISDPLEAHHIIPLGSVKKVGESTSELRKNEKNICNSPLNFVYITKSANEMISAKPLESYVALITDEAKSALHIQKYNTCNISDEDIKQILSERYTALKGEIRDKVKRLLR